MHRIYCLKFMTLSNQTSHSINKCIRIIFHIVCQVSIFNPHITLLVFWVFWFILDITEGWEQPKRQIPGFNVMIICARHQTNISKQTTLLEGFDVGPPKQLVCWRGLNRSVHEAMNNISNVRVHFRTRSGNVNILFWLTFREKSKLLVLSLSSMQNYPACKELNWFEKKAYSNHLNLEHSDVNIINDSAISYNPIIYNPIN